jgi:hypothetical protein
MMSRFTLQEPKAKYSPSVLELPIPAVVGRGDGTSPRSSLFPYKDLGRVNSVLLDS